MTRVIQNPTCDFCAKEVTSEMRYRIDISQSGTGKGKFVKCSNKADMCHDCILSIGRNGFKPLWVVLVKNEQSGKWEEVEAQQKH